MPYTCHLVHGKSRHNREAAGMPTTEIDRLTVEQLAEMESEEFDALRVRILESDPDTKRVGVARLTNLIERLNSEPEDELEDVHEVLGLRPVVFRSSDPHPDTRPCPTWCMLAGDSVPRHRIREYTPMDAMHELADCVDVRASFYGGQVTVQGMTLTVNVQVASGLCALVSLAVQVTVVVPTTKTEPEAGTQTTVGAPQLSLAVGAG